MVRKGISLALSLAACAVIGVASFASAAEVLVTGCCPDGCATTVCRPTVEKKTVTKRVYDDVSEPFCLPCSCFGALFHRPCDCSRVMHRKFLVLRQRKCDKCVKKCVPVTEPACQAPCVEVTPCAPGATLPPAFPPQAPVRLPPAVAPRGR